MPKPLPSQTDLLADLEYDPETGLIVSKITGKEAFANIDNEGYRRGRIFTKLYQAHRIIWKMVHGVDPITIDHRNGIKGDNRLENLRSCTVAENSRNYPKRLSQTGYRGVTCLSAGRKWGAHISAGRLRQKWLGSYSSPEEAARAYDRAAIELHGEFATLNFPALAALEASP